ncbi:uncharacterized protein LOC114339384 [Diabrotica virgifera virgifera]|uniref:Uncharacterized protein n=1 Tax=Diabrotica virgifera virgifera TaxID=50390 RepID=A0ABM5KB45_DIAVI|nr:uncharacterized protein LOC114339384 [Diabrotica virgifera virgifera]
MRLFASLKIGQSSYKALIDTGTTKNYAGDRIAQIFKHSLHSYNGRARLANGSSMELNQKLRIDCEIDNLQTRQTFIIMPGLTEDAILGVEFFREHSMELKFDRDTSKQYEQHQEETCNTLKDSTQNTELERFLRKELREFDKLTGPTNLIKHEIKLKKRCDPVKQPYRRHNPAMLQIINQEVDKMLKEGTIEPSASGWSSPIVLVRKKDNSYRFCIDFRKVNELSEKDAYPFLGYQKFWIDLRKQISSQPST